MVKDKEAAVAAIVVYIPFGWDDKDFWHRRKATEALAYALKNKGAVLIVEPCVCPVTGWYRTRERRKLRYTIRQGKLRRQTENIYVLTPFIVLPARWQRLGFVETLNRKVLSWQIRRALRQITPGARTGAQIISWFYRPEFVDSVGLADENCVVYECYDQYYLEQQERELLAKADIVITTSETLFQEKRQKHPRVFLFHNAADVDFFSKVQSPETTVAEEINGLPRPVLGYLGSINEELDMELLRYVADSRPDWGLLMVGMVNNENIAQSETYRHLQTLPNVLFIGWIQENIPNYFKAVDVCLIPLKANSDFNRYRNPNKLYEYTAMGKPVVSTKIPNVHSCVGAVYFADTREDFVATVEKSMVEDGPDKIAERLCLARENTWETRAKKILGTIYENCCIE